MYSVIIQGKEHKTESTKAFNYLSASSEMISWMIDNDDDFPLAAAHFGLSEEALRRRSNKVGYRPDPKKHKQSTMTENAILIHMETGAIDEYCEEVKISKHIMCKRMNFKGYSLSTGSYSLVARKYKPKTDKPKKKPIPWDKILYNPMLSYNDNFKLHQAYHLTG